MIGGIVALGQLPIYGDDTAAGSWKYLVIKNEKDSVRDFSNLRAGMSIIYDGENLVAVDKDETMIIPAYVKTELIHKNNSSLGITLLAPHPDYVIDTIPVSLYPFDKDTVIVRDLSDSMGKLYIDNLDPGEYRLFAGEKSRGLLTEGVSFVHRMDDNVAIELEECPVKPYRVTMDSQVFDEVLATYDARLYWNNDEMGTLLPYTYRVSVDDSSPISIDSSEFMLSNLDAGQHSVAVTAVTPLGAESETANFIFRLEYPASDFIIRIISDNEKELPVNGLKVTLSMGEFNGRDVLELTSDEDGEVCFTNLFPGQYILSIEDPASPFSIKDDTALYHGYRDSADVRVEETVLPPENLLYTVTKGRNGKYDIVFNWENPASDLFLHPDYIYVFTSEDEFIGETSEYNFYIEDLDKDIYRYMVYSLSPYGNISEGVEVEVDINVAGIESPLITQDKDWIYYDLNGRRVSPELVRPGLYLRSNGVQTEKVMIK